MTEQINLATVKAFIDGAKQLKAQLSVITEQLEIVTKERDSLKQQVQSQDAQFLRDKDSLNAQHASEVESLRNKLQKEIDDLRADNETELQAKIATYEDKIKQVTAELTQKNNTLLKELQQVQDSHKAVINRIRGLEV